MSFSFKTDYKKFKTHPTLKAEKAISYIFRCKKIYKKLINWLKKNIIV